MAAADRDRLARRVKAIISTNDLSRETLAQAMRA